MKGLIFTEFLDTVDDAFGESTTDRLVSKCPLSNGGAFTAVGSYDPQDLHTLVEALSTETSLTPMRLQQIYGRRLFGRFNDLYPEMIAARETAFDLLGSIEDEIHVDVLKLYPDAELPSLLPLRHEADHMILRYRSPRRLEWFCQGLIEGCLDHYATPASVIMIEGQDEEGIYHDFDIRLGVHGPR